MFQLWLISKEIRSMQHKPSKCDTIKFNFPEASKPVFKYIESLNVKYTTKVTSVNVDLIKLKIRSGIEIKIQGRSSIVVTLGKSPEIKLRTLRALKPVIEDYIANGLPKKKPKPKKGEKSVIDHNKIYKPAFERSSHRSV